HPEGDGGEGDIDEEHQSPRDGVDEPAAQERAQCGGDAGQARPGADRRAVVLGAEAGRDEREAPGHEERAADALQRAGGDQHTDARSNAAEHRRSREPYEADDEHASTAVLVSERAAQQEQRAQRQEIPVERPLQAGQPAAEVLADVGQGDVDDSGVEERDARPEYGGEDHPPAARRAKLDLLLRRRGRAGRLRHEAALRSRSSDSELMQYRRPVGPGPSSKTWPRWPPHRRHTTSVRVIPWLRSGRSSTASATAGSVKLGQPVPDSNFVSELN